MFVVAQKLCRTREALVPQKHQPTSGLEDTYKLAPCPRAVEPVRGLRRRDEVHAVIRKLSRLGRSRKAGELGECRKQTLARLTHLRIGLNAENRVAVLEQDTSSNPRAGGYVGNPVTRRQAAFGLQGVDHLRRISRPIAHVVLDAIG